MAFYVRKINNLDNLKTIQESADVSLLEADILKAEFATNGGTLSTWKIEDINEIDEAVLATSICFKQLSDMYFLLIDESLFSSNHVEIKQEDSGHYLCDTLENRHYNIKNLTVGNIKNSILLIKSAIQKEDIDNPSLIFLKTESEIREIITEAYKIKKVSKKDIQEQLYNNLKKKDKSTFIE